MIRYAVTISGRVQGVGCRFFTQHLAVSCNLTGYVKNLHNGNVYMEVQGNPADMEKFLQQLERGDRFVRVSGLEKAEMNTRSDEKRFEIRY